MSLFYTIDFGYAQTTGKIAGIVQEADTGEPLVGANVLIEETSLGASVDVDGTFFVINVPPGSYTVSIEMLGYETAELSKLSIKDISHPDDLQVETNIGTN